MVYSCCICKWRAGKKPPRSLHKFPTNISDNIKWLEIVAKSNAHLQSRPRVCSLHFTEDCFRYGAIEGKAFIKQGSFPTLHLSPESAETSNNSVASSSSTDIKNVSLADGINFCETSCSSSTPKIEECLSTEIKMERIDDVIEEPPTKQICLEKPIECSSIESKRELYLKKRLKEKMKKISSLKRINRRLCKNKSNMKAQMSKMQARIRQLQRKEKEHIKEKELMHNENINQSNNIVATSSPVFVPQRTKKNIIEYRQDQSSDVNTECTGIQNEEKSTMLTNENILSSLKTKPLSPSPPSSDLSINSEDDDRSGDESIGALSKFLETEVAEHNMKFLQMLQAGIERYYKSQQKFNVQSCSTLKLNECYTEPGDHKKEIVANSKIYFPITIIKQIERKAEKETGICDWKYVVKHLLHEVYGDNISKYTAIGSKSKFKESSRPGIDSQLYKTILVFVRSKSNKEITEKMYNQYINKLSYNKRTAVNESQQVETTDNNLLFFGKIIQTVEKNYEIQQKATLSRQDQKLPDWCTMPARKKTKISETYNVYLPSSSVSYIEKKSETCNGTRDWKILVNGAILEIYGDKIRNYSAKGTRGERPAIDTELYRAIYDWACKTSQEEIDEKKFIEVINRLASNKRKSSKKKSV